MREREKKRERERERELYVRERVGECVLVIDHN